VKGRLVQVIGIIWVVVLVSGTLACGRGTSEFGGQLDTGQPGSAEGISPAGGPGGAATDTSPRLTPDMAATASPSPETTSPAVASPTLASAPATVESLPSRTGTLSPEAGNEGNAGEPLPPSATFPAETLPAPTATVAAETGERIHIVAAGENLYQIGLRYGLSWVAIAEYNGLTNPDQISVGQELRIPPSPTPAPEGATPEAAAPPASDPIMAAGSDTSAPVSGGASGEGVVITAAIAVHQVVPGDTLYSISARYNISWAQIAEANGLSSPNQIVAGQALKIPGDKPGPAPSFTHQVHAGESLARIAGQYGVTLSDLAETNGLSAPYIIYRGQVLVIPEKSD